MKKLTDKQRSRDVKRSIRVRNHSPPSKIVVLPWVQTQSKKTLFDWGSINAAIDQEIVNGLVISKPQHHQPQHLVYELIIHLPKNMNLSTDHDATMQCIMSIRRLVSIYEYYRGRTIPKKAYRLININFDQLTSISTSAALVLTAEIAKWDNAINKKLEWAVEKWNIKIYRQFQQLGFFDLFDNKSSPAIILKGHDPDVSFVRYIKGQCDDAEDARFKKKTLKNRLIELVGEKVPKWTLLHSGINEAVTNVIHHAYKYKKFTGEKVWYLTGSYNKITNEMKIAFYDQGIGIPNSLIKSGRLRTMTNYLKHKKDRLMIRLMSKPKVEQDAYYLQAAVSIDRSRTGEADRGKGLQDLLEFIRQRKEGYLSIFSYHGLYKYWMEQGRERTKKVTMDKPLHGTLIIWSVKLG